MDDILRRKLENPRFCMSEPQNVLTVMVKISSLCIILFCLPRNPMDAHHVHVFIFTRIGQLKIISFTMPANRDLYANRIVTLSLHMRIYVRGMFILQTVLQYEQGKIIAPMRRYKFVHMPMHKEPSNIRKAMCVNLETEKCT